MFKSIAQIHISNCSEKAMLQAKYQICRHVLNIRVLTLVF